MRDGADTFVSPCSFGSVSMVTPRRVTSPSAGVRSAVAMPVEEAIEQLPSADASRWSRNRRTCRHRPSTPCRPHDAQIGGGNVGMSTNDKAGDHEIKPYGLRFDVASGVKMTSGIGLFAERAAGGDGGFDGAGRDRSGHEDAALRIDDEHALTVAAFDEIGATAGRARGRN